MTDADELVSKSAFAALVGVSPAAVTKWLRLGRIDGKAIVGVGRSAKIRASVARAQLRRRLDPVQRASNGKARLGAASKTSDAIQVERLRALRAANEAAEVAAKVKAGVYVEADAMRVELGRVAGRVVALYDGMLPEVAETIAAASTLSARDALHVLRKAFRAAREKIAAAEGEAAAALPPLAAFRPEGGLLGHPKPARPASDAPIQS
jgi:phage terminase Nu1 subunit (DNA packaging protein)